MKHSFIPGSQPVRFPVEITHGEERSKFPATNSYALRDLLNEFLYEGGLVSIVDADGKVVNITFTFSAN